MEIFDPGLIERIIKNDRIGKKETVSDCAEPTTVLPKEMPIGMCYVPMQQWGELYSAEVGLSRGTIFPELDKPFIGEEAVKNGR